MPPGSGQGGPTDGSDKFLLASKQGPRRAVWPAYSKSRRRSSDGASFWRGSRKPQVYQEPHAEGMDRPLQRH